MKDYEILKHYANFRKAVVSDVPDDICLNGLKLNIDEKNLIFKGLPLLRNFIISIYDSIIKYKNNSSLPQMEKAKNSNEIMKERREAASYINRVFLSLYCISSDGIYDNEQTIMVSKNYLKDLQLPQDRPKLKFQQDCLKHYEHFCLVEYLKNGETSDWINCDYVQFVFDEKELCFTLQHLVKSGIEPLYFQYGDFRSYSKSGQTEDKQNRFPESVRLKLLGNKKYKLYQKLCKITREELQIEQTGENPYQGGGYFQLLCDYGGLGKYKNTYENSRIALCLKKEDFTVELRLGFDAFEKLPEIIEKLTVNVSNGFLNLRPCSPKCTHKCTNKRFVVFNENIYPDKLLNPCKCETASCKIENEADVQSIILIYEHIKKYTKVLKC